MTTELKEHLSYYVLCYLRTRSTAAQGRFIKVPETIQGFMDKCENNRMVQLTLAMTTESHQIPGPQDVRDRLDNARTKYMGQDDESRGMYRLSLMFVDYFAKFFQVDAPFTAEEQRLVDAILEGSEDISPKDEWDE